MWRDPPRGQRGQAQPVRNTQRSWCPEATLSKGPMPVGWEQGVGAGRQLVPFSKVFSSKFQMKREARGC